jgi:hypothetical protein
MHLHIQLLRNDMWGWKDFKAWKKIMGQHLQSELKGCLF